MQLTDMPIPLHRSKYEIRLVFGIHYEHSCDRYCFLATFLSFISLHWLFI